jgi:SAM-dependent methyltransferase
VEAMSSIDEIVERSSSPNKWVWLNEAKFGFRYVRDFCGRLPGGASVLEVGCGSGILLGMLAESFTTLKLEGIEPFGVGFGPFKELNTFFQEHGLRIENVGYEQYRPDKKFDLIYLVNVFEHLPVWRDFLGFVERNLKPGGVCLILCPNYGFPYESHFGLPVLFNKRLTGRVFAKSIQRHELQHGNAGLWRSLNFVKLRDVKKEVRGRPLQLRVRRQILDDLIDRWSSDEHFAARQRMIGGLAAWSKKLGLTRLLKTNALENYLPYMMLELRRRSPAE